MWANDNHTLLAIVSAVACNGWVLYVVFQAHIAGIQADIARANYRIQMSERFAAAAAEDEEDEKRSTIEKTITTEWDI